MKFPKLTNVSSLQLFQLMRFGGFFITGIILVKLGTPLHIVGNYEKMMFIAGIASFFWVQGLTTTLLSNYTGHQRKEIYLFNVFLLISLLSITAFILLRIFQQNIENIFSDSILPGYHYLAVFVLFNAPCYLIETIYILRHKSFALVNYGFISTTGTIAAVILPVYYGYSMESAIAMLALWSALRYLWLLRILLKYIIAEINISFLKAHLIISAPLILSFLVAGSAEYIDGFLVTHFFAPEKFAIFRYGARELPLSLLMANALSTVMIPLIKSNNGQTGYDQLKKETIRLMNIIFPVSLILLAGSTFIYSFFFNHQFKESAAIFNIYLLLAISRTLLPQSIIYANNGTKALLGISIAEIIINCIASYLLLFKYGLIGIAWGTIIAHFSEKIMMGGYLLKWHGIKPYVYIPSRWYFYSAILLLVYFFS
ncbi:MAG: lipid II flippase MurJ [Bacteroidota bacterium]